MDTLNMDGLRNYKDKGNYYSAEDIALALAGLAEFDLREFDGLKEDLENALYWLQAAAQNPYNSDYFRTIYNVLLTITEKSVEGN